MAKPSIKLFHQIIAVAIVLLFLWLCWYFVDAMRRANPSVVAAVIGGMATAVAGIGGVLLTQSQTKRREIDEAHREKKVEIYQQFLEIVARLMAKDNPHVSLKPPDEKELVDFMLMYRSKIILWGSPEVIKSHLAFEQATKFGGNTLLAVNKLYLAIRADLGLNNVGLTNQELIRMYLKDPSELDRLLPNGKESQFHSSPIARDVHSS